MNKSMEILLWMPRSGPPSGGHRVQMIELHKALVHLGLAAEVSFSESVQDTHYDVVHGFGLGLRHIRQLRSQRSKPAITLTSTYNSFTYRNVPRSFALIDRYRWKVSRVKRFARFLICSYKAINNESVMHAAIKPLTEMRAEFESVDLIMPNSVLEMKAIQHDLSVSSEFHVVRNGINENLFKPAPGVEFPRDIDILMVGRLEPHKNHIPVIRYANNHKRKLVIVGHPHPDHTDYRDYLVSRSNDYIKVIEGIDYEQIPPLMHRSKIHVLCSMYETCGLVSLEAIACGCKPVSTAVGYASEYLSTAAEYVNPLSYSSISKGIDLAFVNQLAPEERRRISENYTWALAARDAVDGYSKLVTI